MPGPQLYGGNMFMGCAGKRSPHQPPAGGSFSPQGRSQSDIYYLKRVIYHGFYRNRWPVRGR